MEKIFSDSPAQTDLLGRDKFANEIALSLLNNFPLNSDSLVFGLNGRWGSGKSTLMNFIIREMQIQIEKDDKIIIYDEFNPWMFSGQEQLQKEFLKGLKEKLQHNSRLKEYFKSGTEKAKSILDIIPDSIDLSFLPDAIKKFIPAEELKIPYKTELGKALDLLISEKSVVDLKKAVDKLIQKEEIKLYIFIDDLDRLTPDEVIQIFQLIKLNANFKNTVFIVAYDAEVVLEALKKHYGENGKRYLSKIVQVDYTIPEITVDEIEDEFFKHIEVFIKNYEINYRKENFIRIWHNEGFKSYFLTLRDVYRFINAIQFRLPVIKEDVNFEHFLVLEAIRVFDFKSYQTLYHLCKENLQSSGGLSPLRGDDDSKDFENLISYKLVRFLFPQNKVSLSFWQNDSKKEIYDRLYFENYFSLKVTGSMITEKEFREFMTIPQQRRGIINNILENGRLDNFIRKLTNSEISKDYKIEDSDLFLAIFEIYNRENILTEKNNNSLFYALDNLARNFTTPHIGYQKLIDIVISSDRELNLGKYWILHFFCFDLKNKDNISSEEYKDYSKVLFDNEEKIIQFRNVQLKKWNSTFALSHTETESNRYIKKVFIIDFAKYLPDEYIEQLDFIFKHLGEEQRVILLLLETILMLDDNNKPVRINGEALLNLLPNKTYLDMFTEALKKMDDYYLNDKTKEQIAFFLNPLSSAMKID
jgi:hypothetical protein